jgi:hypothetical protein
MDKNVKIVVIVALLFVIVTGTVSVAYIGIKKATTTPMAPKKPQSKTVVDSQGNPLVDPSGNIVKVREYKVLISARTEYSNEKLFGEYKVKTTQPDYRLAHPDSILLNAGSALIPDYFEGATTKVIIKVYKTELDVVPVIAFEGFLKSGAGSVPWEREIGTLQSSYSNADRPARYKTVIETYKVMSETDYLQDTDTLIVEVPYDL